MAISVLSNASRFNLGSELWIIPSLEDAQVILEIDWYLNFQISKYEKRIKAQRDLVLDNILHEVEWPLPSLQTSSNSPLMISSSKALPCRWLIVLPQEQNIKSWTNEVLKVWTSLGKPSLRVFLPKKFNSSDWITSWRGLSTFEEVTVVLDSSEK